MKFLRVLLHLVVIIVILACVMGVDDTVLQQGTADMSLQTTQSAV